MVELITVIAIIGILMSLLLPAVQAARESSRRSRCQTRQRQLAIAMINYASQKTDFPHGAIQSTGDSSTAGGVGPKSLTWFAQVLPYV